MGDIAGEAGNLVEKTDSSVAELIKLIERLVNKATEDRSSEAEKIAKRIHDIDGLISGETNAIDALDDEIDKLEDQIDDFEALPEGVEKKAKRKAAGRLRRKLDERKADREADKRAKEALQEEKQKLIGKLGS